jgi:hypothetical protein
MMHLPLDRFCGSSPERLQQWNVNAGIAELIFKWAFAGAVQFTRHSRVSVRLQELTLITFGSGRAPEGYGIQTFAFRALVQSPTRR